MRKNFVLGFLLIIFAVIIFRLAYWQTIKGPTLAEAASDQYYFKLTVPPIRGEILSSDAQPLVTNTIAYSLYGQPLKIVDKVDFSRKVSQVLHLDEATILERISQPNIVWVPLIKKVDDTVYKTLTDLKLEGIASEKDGKRFYAESSMAAHLLGFVGSDESGDDVGYFGLEGYYNQALTGKSGSLTQEKDARGLPIVLGESKRIAAEDGQNLELFLDRSIQFIVEENLKSAISQYGAKEGLVVVMDPKTGGILAAANYPSFDPANFATSDKDVFTNSLISKTYEPGSTFKALVMAAAINEHAVTPETPFNENGPTKVGEYAIKTWNDQYHGTITMRQVLEMSSNPGMVFVGTQLGSEKLYQYIQKFGFGEKTGIDLQGEEAAILHPLRDWHEIDAATTTFGQGIAVTPIQMVTAVAALANEGKLMEPKVVAKIIDTKGKEISRPLASKAQVITPQAAKTITDMLVSAVDNGEAKWAKPKGYKIAGKTGTAQIAIAGHYDATKTIASFVGFAPADEPKFVMLTLLREPQTSQWGSETAAPLFFKIAKELFTYYGIAPKD